MYHEFQSSAAEQRGKGRRPTIEPFADIRDEEMQKKPTPQDLKKKRVDQRWTRKIKMMFLPLLALESKGVSVKERRVRTRTLHTSETTCIVSQLLRGF